MSSDPLHFFDVSTYLAPAGINATYAHREIGHFSINEDRYFLQDESKLGNLKLPLRTREHLDIDLNAGFEEWKELLNVQQHLDSMLLWILLNKQKMTETEDIRANSGGLSLNVDFVTSRGNLTRILNVLNGRDGKRWTMVATRYRNTVYLSHIEEEKKETPSSFAQRICYWGKRFEVEVTEPEASRSGGTAETPQGPIKAYPGFFSVVRFQLGNHVIALRAEVDARVEEISQEPPGNYAELKVVTETILRGTWAFRKKKLIPWWCQSVISGTPLIVYGIRNYDGHVTNIQQIRTDEIPALVQREQFDKEKYLHFLSDVLSWMTDTVREDDPAVVYMFSWDPNAPYKHVTVQMLPRDQDNSFLRDWYVDEMEKYFLLKQIQEKTRGTKREAEKMQRSPEYFDRRYRSGQVSSDSDKARSRRSPSESYGDVSYPRTIEGSTGYSGFSSQDVYDAPRHRHQDRDGPEGENASIAEHYDNLEDQGRRRSPQTADDSYQAYSNTKRGERTSIAEHYHCSASSGAYSPERSQVYKEDYSTPHEDQGRRRSPQTADDSYQAYSNTKRGERASIAEHYHCSVSSGTYSPERSQVYKEDYSRPYAEYGRRRSPQSADDSLQAYSDTKRARRQSPRFAERSRFDTVDPARARTRRNQEEQAAVERSWERGRLGGRPATKSRNRDDQSWSRADPTNRRKGRHDEEQGGRRSRRDQGSSISRRHKRR